jgi:hypothetical protein
VYWCIKLKVFVLIFVFFTENIDNNTASTNSTLETVNATFESNFTTTSTEKSNNNNNNGARGEKKGKESGISAEKEKQQGKFCFRYHSVKI